MRVVFRFPAKIVSDPFFCVTVLIYTVAFVLLGIPMIPEAACGTYRKLLLAFLPGIDIKTEIKKLLTFLLIHAAFSLFAVFVLDVNMPHKL